MERKRALFALAVVFAACSSSEAEPSPSDDVSMSQQPKVDAGSTEPPATTKDAGMSTSLTVRSLAVGARFGCALGSDDKVYCWGATLPPPPAAAFSSLYAGIALVCGLTRDGTAQCWGDCAAGSCTVPAGEKLTLLAPGGSHACGLRRDGTAVCWGDNVNGQASPDPNLKFKQLAASDRTTCGITVDDTMQCWGFMMTNQATGNLTSVSMLLESACGLRPDGTPVVGDETCEAKPFLRATNA